MQYRTLGKTGFRVSEVTLGGGGIGMVWGETTQEECIATVKQAIAAGINIIDVAPMYGKGKAEEIVGTAWPDLSDKPLIATKVFIRPQDRDDLPGTIRQSLEASLTRMGLDQVDVFQLHNQIEPKEPTAPFRLTLGDILKDNGVLSTMQQLKEEALTRAIGFTGFARHDATRELCRDARWDTIQLVTNILNSEGEMGVPDDAQYQDHLEMIRLSQAENLGVFGIRPFAAGSLTAAIDRSLAEDHPVAKDFAVAQQQLGFLSAEGSLASMAMRYALSLDGVSSVVTGAKNQAELAEAIAAAQAGRLPAELLEQIAQLQQTVFKKSI